MKVAGLNKYTDGFEDIFDQVIYIFLYSSFYNEVFKQFYLLLTKQYLQNIYIIVLGS